MKARPGQRYLRVLVVAASAGLVALQFSCKPRIQEPVKTTTELLSESPSIPDQPIVSPPSRTLDVTEVPSTSVQDVATEDTLAGVLSEPEQKPTVPAALLDECEQVMESLSTSFPELPDVYEVRARFSKWRGDTAEAEKHWQKCLDLDPKYGHAYYGMGKVAAQRGKIEESVELFRKAMAVMPNFPQVEIDLCRALINLDRTTEAIELLEKRREKSSLAPEASCLLGEAYLQQKDYEKARRNYQAAVDASPDYSEAYYGLATALTRLGQPEKSAEYLRRFREIKSKLMEARTVERNEFQDLPAMSEDIAAIYTDAGRIYFLRRKAAEAERIWRRAAALAPSDIECRQSLAWLYRETGRFEKAINTLQQLADIESDKTTYLVEIGRLHAQAGQFEAAEKVFQNVSAAFPQDVAAYSALAEMYLKSNRKLTDAVQIARKVVERSERPSSYALLAAAQEHNNDLPGARTALQRALELEPENAKLLIRLGRVDAQLNDFSAAEKAFRTVCTIAPENPVGYSELAHLYLASRRNLPEAIELAQKVTQLDPSAAAYLLLSEAYRASGLDVESAEARKKAAELSQRAGRSLSNVNASNGD